MYQIILCFGLVCNHYLDLIAHIDLTCTLVVERAPEYAGAP
jgi:hypothetical protein